MSSSKFSYVGLFPNNNTYKLMNAALFGQRANTIERATAAVTQENYAIALSENCILQQ